MASLPNSLASGVSLGSPNLAASRAWRRREAPIDYREVCGDWDGCKGRARSVLRPDRILPRGVVLAAVKLLVRM